MTHREAGVYLMIPDSQIPWETVLKVTLISACNSHKTGFEECSKLFSDGDTGGGGGDVCG